MDFRRSRLRMKVQARRVHACPQCGAEVRIVHRHFGDRVASLFLNAHRYHCGNPDCGWEGIISRPSVRKPGTVSAAATWASRLGWMAAGVAVAVTGLGAIRIYRGDSEVVQARLAKLEAAAQQAAAKREAPPPAAASRAAATQAAALQAATPSAAAAKAAAPLPAAVDDSLAPADAPPSEAGPEEEHRDLPKVAAGESFDGVALPDDDVRLRENQTDLAIRRGCVWGAPGRTPYKGTVRQALVAARLPEEVVRKIDLMVERRMISDRVMITKDAIRGVSTNKRFDPNIVAMGFGKTMCFGTRVNFAPGHVEVADLYEATDADGNKFSVMVPYVCRNVSVLAARAERAAPRVPGGIRGVPEPATLASVASALAAMLAGTRIFRRRKKVGESN